MKYHHPLLTSEPGTSSTSAPAIGADDIASGGNAEVYIDISEAMGKAMVELLKK